MKKIIFSLVALLASLGVNAQTATTRNVVEIYKNGSLLKTYVNNGTNYYRAELSLGDSNEKQVLVYKYLDTDNQGSVVETYTNSTDDTYRADLKQIQIAGTASANGRDDVKWVQLWAGGPKWAMVNVGATITDYTGITDGEAKANVGNYYSWGAMEDQTAANYAVNSYSTTDIQGTNHDTAKMNWGNNWKMYNNSQFEDLMNTSLTKWEWCDGSTTQFEDGCTLAGYKITGVTEGYTENSMFLPAAGMAEKGTAYAQGYFMNYWCSTAVKSGGTWGGYCLYGDDTEFKKDADYASWGYSVRAIYDETASDPVMWVKDITVDGQSNLTEGATVTFTATVTPAEGVNTKVIWSSGSEKVATVDQNGLVTAVGEGETIIRATATDGSGVYGGLNLSVKKNE